LKEVISINSNTLSFEFGACDRFGIDPYIQFQRPREWRRSIVGYHLGKNAIEAMYAYDKHPPK